MAMQRSLMRRRASGSNQPIDSFFMQRFDKETVFRCRLETADLETVNW
jgi:hypothetical protein